MYSRQCQQLRFEGGKKREHVGPRLWETGFGSLAPRRDEFWSKGALTYVVETFRKIGSVLPPFKTSRAVLKLLAFLKREHCLGKLGLAEHIRLLWLSGLKRNQSLVFRHLQSVTWAYFVLFESAGGRGGGAGSVKSWRRQQRRGARKRRDKKKDGGRKEEGNVGCPTFAQN